MQLTLVRHAKSSWKKPALADRDRPLNGRGKRDAPVMAHWLAGRAPDYDALLTSPARRARRTAAVLCEALGVDSAELSLCETLYTFDGEALLSAIRSLDPGWHRVLMVGHNPAITEVVEALCRRGIENVPTCGVADMRLSADSWQEVDAGCGALMAFETPKGLKRREGG